MKPSRAQLQSLARQDPGLGQVMKTLPEFPGFPGKPEMPYFHTLARIIIYQQLATGAASTIHRRVRKLGPRPRRFPTAGEILLLPQEELRNAGLSRNKLASIRDLAERVETGSLSLRDLSRQTDEEVVRKLTRVRGIGEWSAQMFLLFRLGRLDIFAPGDLGLREGIRILDGLPERPTPGSAAERARVWTPLRSVASWYLWRLADRGGV